MVLPALLAVVAASAALNFRNLDFPLGYHADEGRKVFFVLEGQQNFYHPILLLQMARVGCALVGAEERGEIIVVGRAVSATSGVALVVVVFLLARRKLSPLAAVAPAAIVGLSPIVAVHAHYFKEDILFTLAVALALLAGAKAEERPAPGRVVGLGVALGLAVSSKYVGALLAPLLLGRAALAVRRAGKPPLSAAGLALVVATAVFSVVNYPMFLAPETFRSGLSYELHHMATGHGPVVISPLRWGFSFHMLHSLVPGLTAPVALLSLAALVAHVVAWQKLSSDARLWLLIFLLFYLSAELSPSKPHPDSMRYMLPVVPSLALLAAHGVGCAATARRWLGWVCGVALAGAVGWSAVASFRLVDGMASDTRAEAKRWLDEHGEVWKGEWFTPATKALDSVAVVDPDAERQVGTRYLVASSFMYERAFLVCERGPCGELRPYYEGYRRLFRYSYLEIRPEYRSFAFSNPVIRIVDLHSEPVVDAQ